MWSKLMPDMPEKRLRNFISAHAKDGCKILSVGKDCKCPLCDLDRILNVLRWYGEEAEAIARNANKDYALMSSVHVLMLDAGKRADKILKGGQDE